MKQSPGAEYLQQLLRYQQQPADTKSQYARLRNLLQRVCKDLTADDPVQFSNLFSRLNFVCNKTKLSKKKKYQVNHFRVQSNEVLRHGHLPTKDEYLQDIKALAQAISHFYSIPLPAALTAVFPKQDKSRSIQRVHAEKHTRIRVQVENWDEEYIYAIDEDHPAEEPLRIKYNVQELNMEFNSSVAELWKGCQLNLVDTYIDEAGVYYPEFIIVEPDYLIDVTALAECFKEYGNHPLHYIYGRLQTMKNSKHVLMGNAANFFLDEFINKKPGVPVSYTEAIKKVFKASPLEFSTCKDFDREIDFTTFINDTRTQFSNIRQTVDTTFKHPDHAIDPEKTVLEPAFLSELYGIQGRLDLLDANAGVARIVELKSGRAPWPQEDTTLISRNHTVQTYLYSLVIHNVLKVPYDSLRTYILYSQCNENGLRLSLAGRSRLRLIINTRNLIVGLEKKIASDTSGMESKKLIEQINVDTLVGNTPRNKFLNQYVVPDIRNVQTRFENASLLESDYFHSLYSFVTREHYQAKAGEADEHTNGLSSLWLSHHDDKLEAGEILADLVMQENNMSADTPSITFRVPVQDKGFLPNFRKGDIVMLYERNLPEDKVINKQVFKGTIEAISPQQVSIRFRYKQRNESLFSVNNKYAIEHDMMDANFHFMYKGLYSFLGGKKDRRDLLLNQRKPLHSPEVKVKGKYGSTAIQQAVYKAKAANDYFILVGPPGTGKTSLALRSMVEEFYIEPEQNILLLAFTNRAVDEICDALSMIRDQPPFLRIGSEISCEDRHKDKLLDHVIAECNTREEVRNKIAGYRIFVGTVTSISGKMELFKLKHFPVAIVDEASQILEPQLLPILSAIDAEGQNAIGKFILIGDHKQLPSVVTQPENDTKVRSAALIKIGLTDRRNSLFERLYRLQRKANNEMGWEMLNKQGRMHPEIAAFPNKSFYQGQLQVVPVPHQTAPLEFNNYDVNNKIEHLLATRRLLFIPSEGNENDQSVKMNSCEAGIVSLLVKQVYELYQKNQLLFDPTKSIGVIAPFRSQIALVRNKIHEWGIPQLDAITIDTVERFQGSQRDIIIYSFTVNQRYQLEYLSNPIKEDGALIDRKLNVALTRARKQLFLTGNPALLKSNMVYTKLMTFIHEEKGFINCKPADFMTGNFTALEKEAVNKKRTAHKKPTTGSRIGKKKISKAR